jgi:hypothetical protein
VFGFHRQSDASPRRHARTAAPDGRRQQSGGGQAAGRMTPSLLYTVVVTRRRRRVTSFAFPPGDAPMGASSDSTDNTAARRLAPPGELGPALTRPRPPAAGSTLLENCWREATPPAPPDPPAESSPRSPPRIHRAGGRGQFGWC